MAPSIEVAMCTWNGARFVAAQLASIVGQTVLPDRIAIYDDASTDDTVSVLRAAIAGFIPDVQSRIRLTVNARNAGYVANFAQAIRHAECDVLFLADQDDEWASRKIERLSALLADGGPDLVFSDGLPIGPDGRPIAGPTVLGRYGLSARATMRFRERALTRLLRRNYVNGAALAVRRRVAQAALPVPDGVPHDYWLALWCAVHGGVGAVREPLYRYRLHDGNAIGIGDGRALHRWLGVWRHPDQPRDTELARWRTMAPRLAVAGNTAADRAVRAKLAWLERMLARDGGRARRLARVVASALRGDYRCYAPPDALSRDVVSTLKPGPREAAP